MDAILMLTQALLAGFSVLGIVAAEPELIGRHLLTLAAAFAGTLLASRVSPSWLVKQARWLFVLSLVVLALVLKFGVGPISDQAARRWLSIGKFYVQPSEFVKIILVLYLASFFDRRGTDYPIIGPVLAIGLAAGMIAAETDLGTATFILALALFILVIIGVPMRRLLAIGMLVLLLAGSVHGVFQHDRLKHVIVRIDAWKVLNQSSPLGRWLHFDPDLLKKLQHQDPKFAQKVREALYQPKQARLIMKAAGPIGHGPGAQPPRILPQRDNDMIFATITYATGWFGAAILLLVYALIFARGLQIAARSSGAISVVALGLTGFLTGQALMNVAVTTAVVPVTGISLPMVSRGGSGLLAAGLAFGILHAISARVLDREVGE
ncbi:FtsW/RodA/SpoVE family cell cycle protein [Oceanithermus sp.]